MVLISLDDIVAAARIGNTSLLQQCTPDDVAHIDINQYTKYKYEDEDDQGINQNVTVLHIAAKSDHDTFITALYKLFGDTIDVDARDNDDYTPLLIAVRYGCVDCITTLHACFGNKINCNAIDKFQLNTLMVADCFGNGDWITTL